MSKNSIHVTFWRQRVKARLVKGFGGRCNRCGYDRCMAAMHFHHLNPEEKSFTLARALVNPHRWETIASEASKCMMLCCLCHTELHAGLWSVSDVEQVPFIDPGDGRPAPMMWQCAVCAVMMDEPKKCCSRSCAAKLKCKITWPPDMELLAMVNESTQVAVARKLGVSNTAVKKRLRRAGLIQ